MLQKILQERNQTKDQHTIRLVLLVTLYLGPRKGVSPDHEDLVKPINWNFTAFRRHSCLHISVRDSCIPTCEYNVYFLYFILEAKFREDAIYRMKSEDKK
ncbi:hypothetical protein TNIN_386361 [Trichonephila inaurata madagascariensis]|uniref:Uncharacterized protein n=1 Tax=Trichonephila inaurata madagascariensis TaxID=2747483 RepID=A0A8X6XA40_9ARAC|nr:hypothetical protein TNIN_386361 [Trichonephila inaurata madagascariensis]